MTTTTDTAAMPEERKDFGAWWETSPCPPWCSENHETGFYAALSDCHHSSESVEVPNRLGGALSTYYAMIWQNVLEPSPKIIIGGGDMEPKGMDLTPGEAGLLVEQLNELLRQVYA